MKKRFVLCSLACLMPFNVKAVEHMLPFSSGMTWRCSQGNYDDPGNQLGYFCQRDENGDGEIDGYSGSTYICQVGSPDCKYQQSNPTHRTGTNMTYAWDFNFYPSDYGKPLLATADCVVDFIGYLSGWGNLVKVKL